MKDKLAHISKFLSLVLRHQPEVIGLPLDAEGFADVSDLIQRINNHVKDFVLTSALLDEVVSTNNKKRFSYNDDKTKIRAVQGHSIEVDLKLEPKTPPDKLYHGTATRFELDILKYGLKKMGRQHVHLTDDAARAMKVGSRHGEPFVYTILAKEMQEDGYKFYQAENGVWLTEFVPCEYLLMEGKS